MSQSVVAGLVLFGQVRPSWSASAFSAASARLKLDSCTRSLPERFCCVSLSDTIARPIPIMMMRTIIAPMSAKPDSLRSLRVTGSPPWCYRR